MKTDLGLRLAGLWLLVRMAGLHDAWFHLSQHQHGVHRLRRGIHSVVRGAHERTICRADPRGWKHSFLLMDEVASGQPRACTGGWRRTLKRITLLPTGEQPMGKTLLVVSDDELKKLGGNTIPQERSTATTPSVRECFSGRAAALQALQAANVSPRYTGSTGAFPLIASYALRRKAIFYRYLSGSSDPRFVGGVLKADTCLTARRDSKYLNTGFGAVGRFALRAKRERDRQAWPGVEK